MASWTTTSLAQSKTGLDTYGCFEYNRASKEQGTDVKSQDFRKFMIDKIRSFENWAWKDAIENPEDWGDYDLEEWFGLFRDYIEEDLKNEVV